MRNRQYIPVMLIGALMCSSPAAWGALKTWDNDSADGFWQTDANWSGDAKPVASDDVIVSNGDTVDVNINGNFPGSLNITLTNNSTLSASAVIRLNNANITVESGSGLTSSGGAFWDLDDADITFDDGAVCTIDDWENKDLNTFTFNLGASGFTTLAPNNFFIGNGSRTGSITNATYVVDMADFTGAAGTITLVDYVNDYASMDNSKFQTATLTLLNTNNYPNTTLTWNNASEAIQLNVVDVTWDNDSADGKWTTAANWSGDTLPAAGNIVHISNGDTVDLDIGGFFPANLTVELSGNSTLSASAVIRLNGATMNVASGSTLTGAGWWDLNNGTLSFVDGASATMNNWEQKGNNTFNFTLSSTGFTPITPTAMQSGAPDMEWGTTTFNIDISAYDFANGPEVVLIDASSHNVDYNDPFIPTVNITGLDGGSLSFDTSGSRLLLQVYLPASVFRLQ